MIGWDQPLPLLAAFGAAALAGAGNAIAGGGTNLSFPILVWLGLPPVVANASNGVGLWPGSVGAAWSYRGEIRGSGRRWWWLVLPSLVGGGIGAWLLVELPPDWFEAVAPWLVIGASALVGVEPLVRRRVERPGGSGRGWRVLAGGSQLLVSVYGGYFGAGIGILLLVGLGLMGLHDLHRANAWKNLLTAAIKGVAVLYFVTRDVLVWPVVAVMAVGSTLAGYVAGRLVQRVDQRILRWIVVALGVGMGVVLLVTGT